MFKMRTLAMTLATFVLACSPGQAQVRTIHCNAVKLSWAQDPSHPGWVIINAYNGCPDPVYVAVCITFTDGTKSPRQSVGLIPVGQVGEIHVGDINSINRSAYVPYRVWNMEPRNPCSTDNDS